MTLCGASALAVAASLLTGAGPLPRAVAGPAQRPKQAAGPSAPEVGPAAPLVDEGARKTVTVLALEGDPGHGRRLTEALRRVLFHRGHEVVGDASLGEVKLALGCTDYEATCLAGAPRVLAVDVVVYGTIRERDGRFSIELFLLRAGDEDVAAHVSRLATPEELAGMHVHGKAQELAQLLWPRAKADREPFDLPPPYAPARPVTPAAGAAETAGPKLAKRMPAWALAGFISGGVDSAIGLGAIVTTGILLRRFADDVETGARESLADGNEFNDIPPLSPDVCDAAEVPSSAPASEGAVTNAKIATACRDGRLAQRLNQVGFMYLGLATVGLATVTISYLLHRRRHRGEKMTKRRFGLMPSGMQIRF